MRSIESDFQFKAYKIDRVEYKILQNIDLLEFTGVIDPNLWEYKIGIRKPLYFEKKKLYVGGIDLNLSLFPKESASEEITNHKPIIYLRAGIVGAFAVNENRFEENVEKQLVRTQIPAILFPYLRAFLSSFLANSGLGSVNFPLINVNKLAQERLASLEVEVKS